MHCSNWRQNCTNRFFKKYDVIFEKVSETALLGKTKRGIGGFGSTGSNWNVPSKRPFPPMLVSGASS